MPGSTYFIEAELAKLAGNDFFKAGKELYNRGYVKILNMSTRDGNSTVRAAVSTLYSIPPFAVNAVLKSYRILSHYECNCHMYSKNKAVCAHVVAAVLAAHAAFGFDDEEPGFRGKNASDYHLGGTYDSTEARDGNARDAASQGAASQDAASRDAATQGAATQGAATQDAGSQGAASQDTTSQSPASQDAASRNAAFPEAFAQMTVEAEAEEGLIDFPPDFFDDFPPDPGDFPFGSHAGRGESPNGRSNMGGSNADRINDGRYDVNTAQLNAGGRQNSGAGAGQSGAGYGQQRYRRKQSDKSATDLIAAYVKRSIEKADVPRFGDFEFEPVLHYADYTISPYLTFRIGQKRMYIVQDLAKFKLKFAESGTSMYGKDKLNHSLTSFSERSRPVLDFVLRRYDENNYLNKASHKRSEAAYYYWYSRRYRNSNESREMFLSPTQADEFFALYEGFLTSRDEFKAYSSVTVVRESFVPRLRLEKTESGARLGMDTKVNILRGDKRLYVFTPHTVYCCDESFADACGELLERLLEADFSLFFAESDLNLLFNSVIPGISPYVSLETLGEFDQYEPLPLECKIYLDSPDAGYILTGMTFTYGDVTFDAFLEEHPVSSWDIAGEFVAQNLLYKYFGETIYRDAEPERVPKDMPLHMLLIEDDQDAVYRLITEGLQEFSEIAKVYTTENFGRIKARPPAIVSVGVKVDSDLLRLDFDLEGIDISELPDILNSYRAVKKYHRLRDGSFLTLEDSALGSLSELAEGLDLSDKELISGQARLAMNRALYLDSVCKRNEEMRVDRDSVFKKMLRDMHDVEDADFPVPESMRKVLRNYQKTGFRWLKTIGAYGFGGILADDMGLGKTIQMLALIQSFCDERRSCNEGTARGEDAASGDGTARSDGTDSGEGKNRKGGKTLSESGSRNESTAHSDGTDHAPSIVVCPASLSLNWESEAQKFTPGLRVSVITGTAVERAELISSCQSYDLIITSYDLLKRDIELYDPYMFQYVIIDEAQYVKNQVTQNAKSVKALKGKVRFALTGTPVENSLAELWSIFDFLMPGYLMTYTRFRKKFEEPIVKRASKESSERLKQLVRPFLLRRLKADVLKELPPKTETTLRSLMNEEQRKIYTAHLAQARSDITGRTGLGAGQDRIMILAALTRIRQICCDPSLLYSDYEGGSVKLDACMELVESCIESGHRMLLFSQFTSMLDIIEKRLKAGKVEYFRIDGSTKPSGRLDLVNTFNAGSMPIFLISLKAGGTGLNLTGADVVIHFDPWWNVSAQNQATDRAHRIGQMKSVQVFKLIVKDTIEERILEMQERKAELANSIIEDNTDPFESLTREELLSLFE